MIWGWSPRRRFFGTTSPSTTESPKISYWQNPAKRTWRVGRPRADEVENQKRLLDAVAKSPSYVIPFEVKYRESARLSQGSGIVEFYRPAGVFHHEARPDELVKAPPPPSWPPG